MDYRIANVMNKYGRFLLRISLAIIFIWFGLLKPLGLSPAQGLVEKTVYWFDPKIFIPILGWWEVAIGVCLIDPLRWFGRGPWLTRLGILLLLLQMPGTFMPLVLLPDVCFERAPFVPTMEGQYIIKNLVLISAAIVVGGTVRHEPGEKYD